MTFFPSFLFYFLACSHLRCREIFSGAKNFMVFRRGKERRIPRRHGSRRSERLSPRRANPRDSAPASEEDFTEPPSLQCTPRHRAPAMPTPLRFPQPISSNSALKMSPRKPVCRTPNPGISRLSTSSGAWCLQS